MAPAPSTGDFRPGPTRSMPVHCVRGARPRACVRLEVTRRPGCPGAATPGWVTEGGLATYAHGYGRDRQASRRTRAHDLQLRLSEGRQHATYPHGSTESH